MTINISYYLNSWELDWGSGVQYNMDNNLKSGSVLQDNNSYFKISHPLTLCRFISTNRQRITHPRAIIHDFLLDYDGFDIEKIAHSR